jgi:predicted metal-dependent TIM-barrel fold hydrolase
MEVIVAIDASDLKDEEVFIAHLQKEGLERIEDEEGFVFSGVSSTPVMQTRAFIMEVVGKALEKSPAKFCNMVCLIGENPMESYGFDKASKTFLEMD